jgi:hypothetical protein
MILKMIAIAALANITSCQDLLECEKETVEDCFKEETSQPKFIDGVSPNGDEVSKSLTTRSPNGWIDRDYNQVTYTSHIPNYINGYDCEAHYCRKTDSYTLGTPWTKGRTTTHTFDLKINKYNQFDGPDWTIMFQDWMLIDANDINGNHPVTTIKLKPMSNGRIKLGHFENSWQFNYSTTSPIDINDPYDYNHNHTPNVERGSIILDDDDMHEWFKIELTIRDGDSLTGGSVTFKVNGKLVSYAQYQTKNIANRHHTAFGMYWAKWYNTDYNYCGNWFADELLCKSTSITIRDLNIDTSYQ